MPPRYQFSVRCEAELYAAINSIAASAGVTTAEWLRDTLTRVVYNQPLGMTEGYMFGRAIGFQATHHALRRVWADFPETAQEAALFVQQEAAKAKGLGVENESY